jgi:hypothetical protein
MTTADYFCQELTGPRLRTLLKLQDPPITATELTEFLPVSEHAAQRFLDGKTWTKHRRLPPHYIDGLLPLLAAMTLAR